MLSMLWCVLDENHFCSIYLLLLGSLIHTKKWLKRHVEEASNTSERDIMLAAYLELFEWNLCEEFPEVWYALFAFFKMCYQIRSTDI